MIEVDELEGWVRERFQLSSLAAWGLEGWYFRQIRGLGAEAALMMEIKAFSFKCRNLDGSGTSERKAPLDELHAHRVWYSSFLLRASAKAMSKDRLRRAVSETTWGGKQQSGEPGGGGTNVRRGRGALTHSEVHCPYRLFSTDPVHQARDFSHAWLFATPRLPGSSVRGILQARILEWVAMPSSRGSSNPGIEHSSLMCPALAGGSFTTRVTSQCRRLQANTLSTPRDHCLRTSPNHSCSILFL